MEFAVTYEFSIRRRVPWDNDTETLRSHLADVRARIAAFPTTENVRMQSDLSRAQTVLEFTVLGAHRDATEAEVVELVASAIRSSGAYHQGMMPHTVEAKLRPDLTPWSGLRTPTWRVKRSSFVFQRRTKADVADAAAAAS